MIPLFKTHYSMQGRSILTIDSIKNKESDEADSIIEIAKNNNLKEIFLVEDTLGSLIPAYENLKEINCKLIFGLNIIVANNLDKEDTEAKYIIFLKNNEGLKTLNKISTIANTEFFRKEKRTNNIIPRVDFKVLKTYFNDNLLIGVPFYDSYVFNNILKGYSHIPDEKLNYTYFTQNNSLPFDEFLISKIKEVNEDTIPSKSIYYKNKKDFKYWQTFKCISRRSTLEKPELNHCSSNEFCWESFLEKSEN